MPGPVASSELLTRIPAFVRRLTELETMTEAGLVDALAASGLSPRDRRGDRTWLTFDHLGHDDPKSFERRLRLAITRVLGTPTGGARHWDAGCVNVGAVCRDHRLSLVLQPQFSMRNLRSAAERWLDGMELRAWLVESGFVDADAEPAPAHGSWPRPDHSLSGAHVWTPGDGKVQVTFFMESGVRPPGTKGRTDADRWQATKEYLAERLGPPDRPGWWRRGSRSFRIEGMRSSSRSITIAEAPPGTVYGPLGRVSTIPTSPDPEPAAAVRLLRALADLRGTPYEDVVASLVAAGVVTDEPPRRRGRGAALVSSGGQPVQIDLVDGRLARGAVEATSATSWDAVGGSFGDAFGPSESHGFDRRWRLGTMVVRHAGKTGDDGFERLRAEVAEDLAGAVGSARSWLLRARPVDDIGVADAWQARCLGAAISAEVVPAVVAGQPVWRVDDRILWLDENLLRTAGPGTWPPWAAGMPPGGSSSPPPASELAAFVEAVEGWRDATPHDARATVLDLGWATDDPDAAGLESDAHASVSLRRPAGSSLFMALRDGLISRWTVELTDLTDGGTSDRTEEVLREVLGRHAGSDEGAAVGEFRLHTTTGVRMTIGRTTGLEGVRT